MKVLAGGARSFRRRRGVSWAWRDVGVGILARDSRESAEAKDGAIDIEPSRRYHGHVATTSWIASGSAVFVICRYASQQGHSRVDVVEVTGAGGVHAEAFPCMRTEGMPLYVPASFSFGRYLDVSQPGSKMGARRRTKSSPSFATRSFSGWQNLGAASIDFLKSADKWSA